MKQITLTGPTGYIGLIFIPRLFEKGYKLKCIARNSEYLQKRDFIDKIQINKIKLSQQRKP